MDCSYIHKRPFDSTAAERPDHTLSSKRRHHYHHPPPPSAGETLFRILCPAVKTGGVIGKGGTIVQQFREETGARIRIDDSIPGSDERVILIMADAVKTKKDTLSTIRHYNDFEDNAAEESSANLGTVDEEVDEEGSPAQQALVRVFERILKVDEERGEEKEEATTAPSQGPVICRLLAPSNQVGCVLGRGGKIVEKIRQETGAQIRVFPRDHIPACAFHGDELIQITGNFSAVRKALMSVSSCLQDNPRSETANTITQVGDQFAQRGYANHNRMVVEEDVVFRLLCHFDKVGSLIGKGGSVIRALQSETGASIKVVDAAVDSDERIVVISARENSEQQRSPAQEAVIRVQRRIAEIGFEPGAAIVARLLVHSQQIGCLLGKGGVIITEMRRATGASIRIFAREQVPKCASLNDEVVQVIGNLQSVQDSLYKITSRIRETIFPLHSPHSHFGGCGPPYAFRDIPLPPYYRPRHDHPASPPSHNIDHLQPAYSHGNNGMEGFSSANSDQFLYPPYGNDVPAHVPKFDRPTSPRSWVPQAASSANPMGAADVGSCMASKNGFSRSKSQAPIPTSTTVEVIVPQALLTHVYGENNSNLNQIKQISGAKVVIHDQRPGAVEPAVVVSGSLDQIRAAQSLVHAFILSEQTS